MDDYSLTSLSESKNEWCSRLVNTLTPAISEGLKSIYNESLKLCIESEEEEKYLMTFQTFLTRIPQWNENIIKEERQRIETSTNCSYLEELITCVHIIQLKALTCVRVGQKQKQIDIDIPSKDSFIHKVYVNTARKIYTNIYLFEKDIEPLQIQKNNRELELIIKESILLSIRDTMPIDKILMAYIEETNEDEVIVEEKIFNKEVIVETTDTDDTKNEKNNENTKETTENKGVSNMIIKSNETITSPDKSPSAPSAPAAPAAPTAPAAPAAPTASAAPTSQPLPPPTTPQVSVPAPIKTLPIESTEIQSLTNNSTDPNIKFSDTDSSIDYNGLETKVSAPKDINHLAELQKRREEENESDEEDESLKIGDTIALEIGDINDISKPLKLESAPIIDDIEVLEPL